MKKLFLLLILIGILLYLPCHNNVKAEDNIKEPEWSEICPSEYLDAKIYSNDEIENIATSEGTRQSAIFYCKPQGKTAKIIRGITIIPAIDCWTAKKIAISNIRRQYNNANISNYYWVERKKQFYNEINTCKTLSKNEKALCYLKIREIELQKTASKQQELYNQMMLRQQTIQNFNTTMNQIETNNRLQNINNSIQQNNFHLQNTNMQLHNINNALRGW
ncbi:MAG: hypothetical protein MJ229_00975 [bacterium]|nr:hypothetical protein [bacterium]